MARKRKRRYSRRYRWSDYGSPATLLSVGTKPAKHEEDRETHVTRVAEVRYDHEGKKKAETRSYAYSIAKADLPFEEAMAKAAEKVALKVAAQVSKKLGVVAGLVLTRPIYARSYYDDPSVQYDIGGEAVSVDFRKAEYGWESKYATIRLIGGREEEFAGSYDIEYELSFTADGDPKFSMALANRIKKIHDREEAKAKAKRKRDRLKAKATERAEAAMMALEHGAKRIGATMEIDGDSWSSKPTATLNIFAGGLTVELIFSDRKLKSVRLPSTGYESKALGDLEAASKLLAMLHDERDVIEAMGNVAVATMHERKKAS